MPLASYDDLEHLDVSGNRRLGGSLATILLRAPHLVSLGAAHNAFTDNDDGVDNHDGQAARKPLTMDVIAGMSSLRHQSDGWWCCQSGHRSHLHHLHHPHHPRN